MAWPAWIERIRQLYVDEEASVFLLHGCLADATWNIGGKDLPCASTVMEMLADTRDVIGIWSPTSGLTFPSLQDASRFDRHVEAARLLAGRLRPLDRTEPYQALALIHQATQTPGLRQGYILRDVHTLAPMGSLPTRWRPLPEGTPGLARWGTDATLRSLDNIVILLADPSAAREELMALDGVAVVHVAPPAAEEPDPDDVDTLEAEAPRHEDLEHPAPAPEADADGDAPAGEDRVPTDPPAPHRVAAGPPDPGLVEAIRGAVERAMAPGGATEPSPHRIPMRQAIADVLHRQRPDRFGAITWSVEDGRVVGTGRGAVDIATWFEDDIAVQASADMILESAAGEGPPEAALRAIARRLMRLLELP